jgi:uncharacterized protein (DUF58 family)
MTFASARAFPLVPRRRFAGVAFGDRRSPRRGIGDEVAGTRPYRPGDRVARIDWAASSRLSAARGTDEFVVREYFAEEAPRVAIVCDRASSLSVYGEPFPWLDKGAAVDAAVALIARSAVAARGELAYVDHDGEQPFWLEPRRRLGALDRHGLESAFCAPRDALLRSLDVLARHAALFRAGSFVFVVSDFLGDIPSRRWLRLRTFGWDVTPVIVQDPIWEQSFPPLGGLVLPLVEPVGGDIVEVLLSQREARDRADANERRLAGLLALFRRLGFDPIVLGTSDEERVGAAFHTWAERRKRLRRKRA